MLVFQPQQLRFQGIVLGICNLRVVEHVVAVLMVADLAPKLFEALSDGLKRMLEDFAAVHSAGPAFTSDTAMEKYEGDTAITYTWTDAVHDEVEHPVVRTHPDTGRKALYVNPMFTQRFSGWTVGESRPLLDYLYAHATKPEFCCRFPWQERSVALWDNRCVQHYAVDDYRDFERVMYRVTVAGDRPA